MGIFSKLFGKVKEKPLTGKAAKLEKGFLKINAFIDKGMKLNPAPKRKSRHKKSQKLKLGKWFFKSGDAGYDPVSGKPLPYCR